MHPPLRQRSLDVLLRAYQWRVRRQRNLTPTRALQVTRQLLRTQRYGFLVTTGTDAPNARLIEHVAEEDLTVWIGAHPSSRKAREVQAHPRATFALMDDRTQANIVLHGTVTRVHDDARRQRYWRPHHRLFFSGPLGADFALLRFTPDRLELMSFGRFIVPEPFGLKPVVLVRHGDDWQPA
ncbi:pyridoxamine 5'-phosphate oxidase family protein [Deinococcus maricopensis]|uniref:Pyridoxamine 5'-phosphate oxidase-related FMN-binding protein n=1 Tax=Deinococcus maricopensis (strain DSM 21211 / LMG 22137 / NRRL B-23946 / LB-34) TaxID=709986 RepID=E8U9G9_DEIML|nr:pyridoxamine 5'-phosphate oxidase family protein [Deinococcus maricopensis]ADV67708.1 pyridoxamine 5'-phosphate oxidase-related FMN-binding protein [Deinococcus maricopensis DSM 21211]